MEFIFIRHAEGKHTLDLPRSLYFHDPALTELGKQQANELRRQFDLRLDDLLIVSPTRRTLQTASILSEGVKCNMLVHPYVGPRVFPLKQGGQTLPCDQLLDINVIKSDFLGGSILREKDDQIWRTGINMIPEEAFNLIAREFLDWCESQGKERVIIVTHDGTITAYRQFMRQEQLSRSDFLPDAGWVKETR